jgi:cysteine desulfurase
MPTQRVYLDHAAGAPLDPAARAALLAHLEAGFGNPGSPHEEGRAAKDALEAARSAVARALGARPREVVFTAGATEAVQIGLVGSARARAGRSRRVVVSSVEHAAVLETARALAGEGFQVVEVPPEPDGDVDAQRFLDAAGADAAVAALMLASHETGARMPVAEVAAALRERDVPLLCDAALGPGRLDVSRDALGADLVAFSGPKFGAPPGSGALLVRRGARLARSLHGGLQEERLRPGRENVPALAGFAAALEQSCGRRLERTARYEALVATFLDALGDMDDWQRVGPSQGGLPGLVTLELTGVEGEAAMINMDLEGFAIATGSTCALGSTDPSPGLVALGMSRRRAASTVRVSVGEGTTTEDVQHAASSLRRIVSRLRALARG